MYKILIVDDEPLNVAGLCAMIDPAVIDLSILPPVATGEEAINAIITQSPDIVILDIDLPEYTGMELVAEIQRLEAPCPLIIMMAYESDFTKVRDALRFGVFDFLVKSEITQLSLNKALIRAVEYMDQFKSVDNRVAPYTGHQLLTRLFYLRLLTSDEFPEEPEDVMRHLDIRFSYAYYCVMYMDTLEKNTMPKSAVEAMQRYIVSLLQKNLSQFYACQAMPWSAEGYVIILAGSEPLCVPDSQLTQRVQHILDMIEEKFGVRFAVGIGSDVTDPKCIRNSFIESQNTYSCATEDTTVIYYPQVNKACIFDSASMIRPFQSALDNEDMDELESAIQTMTDCLQTRHYNMKAVLLLCSDILHLSLSRVENLTRSILAEFPKLPCPTVTITSLKNGDDVIAWLRMLQRHIEQCVRENGKERKVIVVEAMKEYISQHCEERLSLQSVAEAFFFSTSYVSRLFKQCSDVGFSDYVTKTKLEHSKELLQNTDATVLSVASQLGYDDPYYFSRVFKKHNGISPREYMLQHRLMGEKKII